MGPRYIARAIITRRESQVLAGRLRGLTVKEVAVELGLSRHTVRHHSENVYRKLKVHSFMQAITALAGNRCRKCRLGLFSRLNPDV